MRIVTAQELQDWLSHGEVLEKDSHGPKVVALDNGLFLKIFHTRRHPLLARLRPGTGASPTTRRRLQAQGHAHANDLRAVLDRPRQGLSACLYEPLAGQPFDQLFRETRQEFDAAAATGRLYPQLHQRGIYFRSLHLGNILQTA